MRIKQIMTSKIITASTDDNLKELNKIFESSSIHHLPVINEQKQLIGILSDRDVSKATSPFIGTDKEREQDLESLSVIAKDIMSSEPITVSKESRIDTASILLLEHNFSCLPVIDENGILEGIVTWKDILNYHIYA